MISVADAKTELTQLLTNRDATPTLAKLKELALELSVEAYKTDAVLYAGTVDGVYASNIAEGGAADQIALDVVSIDSTSVSPARANSTR